MKNVKDKQSVMKGLPKLKDAKLDVSVTDHRTTNVACERLPGHETGIS